MDYLLQAFERVFPTALDAGNLNAKFDVLIFPTEAIPARDRTASVAPANVPAEYRAHLGSVTIARTVPQLKTFVEQGGTLIATSGSLSLVRGTFTAGSFTLSSTEADSITNYADLRLRFTALEGGRQHDPRRIRHGPTG